MCGIWLYVTKQCSSDNFYEFFNNIQNRGPERFKLIKHNVGEYVIYIGFHRLSIMDTSIKGDQPFCIETKDERTIYAMCNGEIYNFEYIHNKYGINVSSNSDCEFITHLYSKIEIDGLCNELISDEVSGEYAITIIDISKDTFNIYSFRDPLGVRPLFIGKGDNCFCITSELKGIDINKMNDVKQIEPRQYLKYNSIEHKFTETPYFSLEIKKELSDICEESKTVSIRALEKVRNTLIDAVECRMHSDREIAFLLSGGLDSSLVCSIGAKYAKKNNQSITTISIGLPGSTDEYYARKVSEYIGSKHIHIELSEQQFLDAIPEVIKTIESYDVTTVRASTGQYLASKWIKENTDIKVLYIGDGSDELFGGYRYFLNYPSYEEYDNEIIRLLSNIHYFDVLRADRGIAGHGLEARVPFLDHRLVSTILSIDTLFRVPQNGVEKLLLREAFNNKQYLPDEILFRKKEAFSDGVSSLKRSWYQILQENIEDLYTNEQLEEAIKNTKHCRPYNKESFHYRNIFESYYLDKSVNVIPYFWMPKWVGDVKDPSARILDVYS